MKLYLTKPRSFKTEVTVIWGETGVGKSKWAFDKFGGEADQGKYVGRDDAACQPKTPAPVTLPHTGVSDTITQIAGAVSLAAASAYYLASRRES